MASKNVLYSYEFFAQQVLSATTTSSETNVARLDAASIDLQWSSSTLVATATVEVRNGDKADWRTIDFGSPITISGASGRHEIIFLTMPFIEMRMTITVTSGSGTVDAVISAKSLGA